MDFYSRCSPSGWRRSRRLSSHRRYGWSFLRLFLLSRSRSDSERHRGRRGMPVGCQIQCKEGSFSPRGLFDCKGDSLLLQAVPNLRGHQPRARAGVVRGVCVPQPAGSGQGRVALCSPESPCGPLCAGYGGGEQSRSGAGSRCTVRTECETRALQALLAAQAGQGHRDVCPFPACPMGKGRPKLECTRDLLVPRC